MNTYRPKFTLAGLTVMSFLPLFGIEPADTVPDFDEFELQEIVVKGDSRRRLSTATNTELITSAELKRAACCSLGESFTTNPSVDVTYSDAATGARQIKLLGLSGTYVQMLQENIPGLRGAGSLYGLGYIPGPWMQSIQVSKGAASVKNGYESVTGQINIESLKPMGEEQLSLNGYFDNELKGELNASGNLHIGDKWSGGLLLHGQHAFKSHDTNGDGFFDMPAVSQFSAFNRWHYAGENYIFQAGVKYLTERRRSGQDEHTAGTHRGDSPLYEIRLDTKRVEAFTKNAFIFDPEHNGNVAAILSATFHDQHSRYGWKRYDVIQKEFYAQLMFEREFDERNSISAGLAYSYDNFRQYLQQTGTEGELARRLPSDHEAVSGGYLQYTYNLASRLTAMGGVRYDYSSLYGSIVTPRVHLRYMPDEYWSLQLSAGQGRHSPHVWAEYSYLLASSRLINVDTDLRQEVAWNYGFSANWTRSIWERKISLSAEYYFTRFNRCLTLNLDRDPHAAYLSTSNRGSRGHTAQVELTADIIDDMSATVAYRFNDVKVDFGDGKFRDRPLTSRSKWLFTWNYAPMMGLWQFDATLAVTGSGRMPTPGTGADGVPLWKSRYPAFCTLNAQITRNFRHWSIYLGGENLTNYKQKDPIIGASNPWGPEFDATMVHGPLSGAMVYIGFRYNFKN